MAAEQAEQRALAGPLAVANEDTRRAHGGAGQKNWLGFSLLIFWRPFSVLRDFLRMLP